MHPAFPEGPICRFGVECQLEGEARWLRCQAYSGYLSLYINLIIIFLLPSAGAGTRILPARLRPQPGMEPPEALSEAVSRLGQNPGTAHLKPKGIIPVDLFGQPADYDRIHAIAPPRPGPPPGPEQPGGHPG